MTIYSNAFAQFYDKVTGNHTRLIQSTKKLLTKHLKRNKNIRLLELACGTGTILQQFPSTYQLYGLDNSAPMLDIAKKKVPKAVFFEADMTNFSLPQKFDVILCIFDSINHLPTFSQWEKVFRQVNRHLDTNGLFIFDVNTPARLATIATYPSVVKKISKNTLVIEKLFQRTKNIYDLRITIVENIHLQKPTVIEEVVTEAIFDIQKVIKSLEKYFTIQQKLDPYRKKISKKTGRIFFTCKKN